ncbi:MAG: type II toxin-antitoxin system HicA family toxin [Coraliomargarita sp.]
MTKKEKTVSKVLEGTPNSISFSELKTALKLKGFTHDRTNGSHEIWVNPETDQSINIQPRPKDKTVAKAYQVREFRKLI